ncbi:DNA-binding transcriptional MocR family regulator [Paraburkholderia sp. 40]
MNDRKTKGLPDQIYGDILNRILEGEYKEGERLPTEHALAERFATSRPTVREALARLRGRRHHLDAARLWHDRRAAPRSGRTPLRAARNAVRYPPLL